MTQPRPTEQEVGETLQQLWRLAHTDTTGYRLVAATVDHLVWVRDALAHAEQDAAYGPGTTSGNLGSIGTGGHQSPVEARVWFPDTADPAAIRTLGHVNDAVAAELHRLIRQWRRELRTTVDRMCDDASAVATRADQKTG